METPLVDTPIRDLIDTWCHTFSLANYPLCESLAVELVHRTSGDARDDDYLHARKSLVQSLHFLGQHAAARLLAEQAWARADRAIDTTIVHPRASMAIILARIACMQGDAVASRQMADIALHYSGEANPISYCQVLALAHGPIAIWTGDEQSARDSVSRLQFLAERNGFNYWMSWGHSLGVALDLVFGKGDGDRPLDIDFDTLDPKQADLLATLDDRLVSDLAVSRAVSGLVGWTRSEILRIQAIATSWYDPDAAMTLLGQARAAAAGMGVVVWDHRLRQAEAQIALAPPLFVGAPSRFEQNLRSPR